MSVDGNRIAFFGTTNGASQVLVYDASSGSRLLTTNTFGGTRARLQNGGARARAAQLPRISRAAPRRAPAGRAAARLTRAHTRTHTCSCCYAHSEDVPTFHRRIYWRIHPRALHETYQVLLRQVLPPPPPATPKLRPLLQPHTRSKQAVSD